jgi:perosamine synthetase
MGKGYENILSKSQLLKPQYEPDGYRFTYYTFSALFSGEDHGISWSEFRRKYMEFGGDGFYAASKLIHQEPAFRDRKIGRGITPIAEKLQRNLMNFTTNQANAEERNIQLEALSKTLKYYGEYA